MQFSQSYKQLLLNSISNEITEASKLTLQSIASEIHEIGFNCKKCGKCCRSYCADNSVILLQDDINRIKKGEKLNNEFYSPFIPYEVENFLKGNLTNISSISSFFDTQGYLHVFGWILNKKSNGDCSFLSSQNSFYECTIYKSRPHICNTYPFYLEKCKLYFSECEGIGYSISYNDSELLANSLLNRYKCELQELYVFYENYKPFSVMDEKNLFSLERFKKENVSYIVHDMQGSHYRSRHGSL